MHFDENIIEVNYEQFEIFERLVVIYQKIFEVSEMLEYFLQKIKVYMMF
jgi:hypothetical protein